MKKNVRITNDRNLNKNDRNLKQKKFIIPTRKCNPIGISQQASLYKAKINFLLKEELNPIRDSVMEGRPPVLDIEGKELPSIKHTLFVEVEPPHDKALLKADPMLQWELDNKKFNTKYWAPKRCKDKDGLIDHNLTDKLYLFWDKFLQSYESESESFKENAVRAVNVFDFLKSSWKPDLSLDELRKIQLKVEDMTYRLRGTSYIENTPQLKTIFFQGKSAKSFLIETLKNEQLLDLVRATPSWGVEPIVILVLSKHFNVFSLEKKGVPVATLIEDFDGEVMNYLKSFEEKEDNTAIEAPKGCKKRAAKKPKSESESQSDEIYPLGRILLNWLLNKELVSIYQSDVDIKTSTGYIQKPSYATCLFDIKLLPLNVTLPMVYPPLEWKNRTAKGSGPDHKIRLGQLTGGYLYSDPKLGSEASRRASPLSSHDESKFDMRIHGDTQLRKVTSVVNKLQGVPYEINTSFLERLIDDWDHFVKYGLVMPKILCSIDRNEARLRLNQYYHNDPEIKKNYNFWPLYKLLLKNITEANYQQNILYLADAYKGYYLYFPCFMDFRGRNYRYGPFHFHERDLVRSLIVFGDPGQEPNTDEDLLRMVKNHAIASAYHWMKGIPNYNTAFAVFSETFEKNKLFSNETDKEEKYRIIYDNALKARHPFQFIAFMHMAVCMESKVETEKIEGWYWAMRAPHQLDASASAFQLSSYLLVDHKMARETNLFVDNLQKDEIQDIYKSMDARIKEYIQSQLAKPLPETEKNVDMYLIFDLVKETFGRAVIKKFFMPMVYGKSKYAIYNDIQALLGRETTRANLKKIRDLCFEYWGYDFVGLNKLMNLVQSICWVASAIQNPVILSNKYWLTHQDYFVKDKVVVTLRYKPNTPKAKTKRSVVTLRIETRIRNPRKTANSTFANFIHQKDALTVINFIQMMMHLKDNPGLNNIDFNQAPIYTVHDNFVTTSFYANYLPYIYRRAVSHMGHPLTIINKLIYDNLITATPTEGAQPTIIVELEAIKKNYCMEDPRDCTPISEDTLNYCLDKLYNNLKDGTERGKSFNQTGWDNRIDCINKCYRYLVQILTSPEGVKRWKSLTACLNRHYDPNKDDYCIHY